MNDTATMPPLDEWMLLRGTTPARNRYRVLGHCARGWVTLGVYQRHGWALREATRGTVWDWSVIVNLNTCVVVQAYRKDRHGTMLQQVLAP